MTPQKWQIGYGDYTRFRDLVLARSGLYFPEKKRTDLEIGLLKAVQGAPAGIGDLDAYYRYLSARDDRAARLEMNRLLNLLTVGETHFFRDSAQFDALSNHVLPSLIANKRASAAAVGTNPPGRPQLRLWCAGCASGEEPFSIAILLYELIPDIHNWNILLLATDINQESLAKAQQALYSDWSFREARALSTRSLYFNRVGVRYQLRDDLRQMVTFARHNLIEDEFPAYYHNTVSMDLIFCRNVTIYFTEATTRQLVAQFRETLVNGGWLVVGHSEPSLLTYHAFRSHTFPGALLYQRADDKMPRQVKESVPMRHREEENGNIDFPLSADRGRPGQPAGESLAVPSQPPLGSNGATPDLHRFLQQRLETNENVAGLVERTLHSLEPALRTPAYCYLARSHADHGRWAEARRWCQQAINQDSLAAEAYYILALVNEQEEDREQAIANLKKVVYLGQEGPVAHFKLALLYRQQGETSQARRSLSNAVKTLEKWPADRPVPYGDGTDPHWLLATARKLLLEFKEK